LVSDRAHLLFDLHKEVDGAREAELAVRWLTRMTRAALGDTRCACAVHVCARARACGTPAAPRVCARAARHAPAPTTPTHAHTTQRSLL
jgi:hypothetical protein